MKPEVTFFIPVKNGVPYIEECIGSILSQSFQNWRLVILDNQSVDDTYSLCSKYLSDGRINYILNDADIGALGNFNKCLELSDTKYYAILSHDDLYSCNRAVEDSFAILESNPDVCAVYSHIDWIDARSTKITTRRSLDTGKIPADKTARKSILSCRNLFGVPLLVRRAAAIGKKYDSAFYSTGDIEFSIAIGRGLSIYVINRPCYSIRFHSTNNTMRDFSRIRTELVKAAEKHGISLGVGHRTFMAISDFNMQLKKFLFYLYLDHIRGYGMPRDKK